MTRGLFVTFEGGDGCGKTTQAELARQHLEATGRKVLRTREPGGTELGVEIRQILLHSRGHVDPKAEALLFAADRAHHINTLVRPALESGITVIQDRYIDSSVAYQGAGRDLDPAAILALSGWATGGLTPDLTVLLDLDPAVAAARVHAQSKQFDRLEAEKADFRNRLRAGFLKIAAQEPERFLLVDATLSVADIAGIIQDTIEARLIRLTAETP